MLLGCGTLQVEVVGVSMSMDKKTVEPIGLESSSSMWDSGKASIMTALLGSCRSAHIKILPDFLCVTTIGVTQAELSID